jgi:RHH-type proline utilization regulon transcriptional repressor/proline dehydrogenase/delta 1-pyrroline-5-carboxylate dehydrogenase
VYLQKWQSDACFERCARYLIENHELLRPAFGSHNVRSLAHAIAAAELGGLPKSAYELQTLFGMGDAIQKVLVERGHRVRVYTPYGAILPGMAYLVRRLLENTSNESFLKASLAESAPIDDLLRDPEELGAMLKLKRRPKGEPSDTLTRTTPSPFRNEPPLDFARAENRESMRQAIESVRLQLGRSYPLTIDGEQIHTEGRRLDSVDPGHSSRIVGQVALAGVDHAEAAVAAARKAFPAWSATRPEKRAAVLIEAARIMRNRRFELAAWEVFECGKPWAEADGDIAEAIDFCEFYAREMCRLAEPRHCDASGETWSSRPGTFRWRFQPE